MNDKLRAAAEAALEMLEDVPYISNKDDHQRLSDVTAKLRAALAEPQQEPVAYRHIEDGARDFFWADDLSNDIDDLHFHFAKCEICEPLYTHPPRRSWVGLTDEEIYALRGTHAPTLRWGVTDFANAIEAALKEKNA